MSPSCFTVKNRYQNNLELRKGSKFVFDYVHLLYYKCHKICGLYIDSPDSIKNKKATIKTINKKDKKSFRYTVTVVLNHEEINKTSKKVNKS